MKKILEKLNSLMTFIAAISIVIILLITSININCFNKDFFASEYRKLDTAQELGMTETDLHKATDTLLDYLQDKRNTIEAEVTLQGTQQMAFNAKEASHMGDVRSLYHFALNLRSIACITLLASLIYLFVRMRKGAFTLLSINYMKTAVLAAVFFIMLGIWAYADFDAFWTAFHRLVFRNDLWLLDPNTDLMINLFPSAFFSSLVFRIVGVFAAGFIGLFVASYAYLRHQLKKFHTSEFDDIQKVEM